jgi:YfiH family protein
MRFIEPDWPAVEGVVALSSTRVDGYSTGLFSGLNLALHVGDDVDTVVRNRAVLLQNLPAGTHIQWLSQVHGAEVVRADSTADSPVADACWSDVSGLACAVMTADCLPVLFCSERGENVAAAHAGWRGLADGVLEACVGAMNANTSGLMAWLGPAIGPQAFEVGVEVREQFLCGSPPHTHKQILQCFAELSNKPGFYLADLYGLARIRLNAMGVSRIYGGGLCTYSDRERFYSYRRDGETGRIATVIIKTPE